VFTSPHEEPFPVPDSLTEGVGILATPNGPSTFIGPSFNVGWRAQNALLFVQADEGPPIDLTPVPPQLAALKSKVSADELVQVAEAMNGRVASLA
jgi:hypothetical protein